MLQEIPSEDYCRRCVVQQGDYEVGGSIRTENGRYVKEALFKLTDSTYWIRGKYGKRTPKGIFWRKTTDNWETRYKPLSVDEAKEWVQKYLAPEVYENIFGAS